VKPRPWRLAVGALLYLVGVGFVAPLALVVAPLAALLALQRPGRREALVAAGLAVLTLWSWIGAPDAYERFGAAWTLLVVGSLVLVLSRREAGTTRLVSSGLLTVSLAGGVGALLVGVTSFSFAQLTWLANRHFSAQARLWIDAASGALAPGDSTARSALAAFESSSIALADTVSRYLPGLVLLQSLAALALAWALYRTIAREPEGTPLPSLREFRFNDHLIWGVVAALVTLVLPRLGPLHEVGGNLAAFFGGLYVLRGVGVLAALFGAAGMGGLGVMLFGVFVVLFLLPVAALVALALGVTDTWVDWRRRAAARQG